MMRLQAPELETKGWEVFLDEETGEGLGKGKQVVGKMLGKKGQMLEEWTTGHPKVCPVTGDLVFYGYNMWVHREYPCLNGRLTLFAALPPLSSRIQL